MARTLEERRYTVYCPDLDSTSGPYTLEQAAQVLRGMRAERDCQFPHEIELIEVTNDEPNPPAA